MSTADPEGKWQMQKLDRIYYDPGMIFEDDKVYVACGIGNIDICELDKNFNFRTSTTVLRDKEGLEGCHLYKIGDYYYIYATYGGLAFRSDDIPFQEYNRAVTKRKF